MTSHLLNKNINRVILQNIVSHSDQNTAIENIMHHQLKTIRSLRSTHYNVHRHNHGNIFLLQIYLNTNEDFCLMEV